MSVTLLIVALIALFLNVPLGIWRAHTKKLSVQWFLAIHLIVPLIYYLRMTLHLPIWSAPIFIAGAILGQLLGGKIPCPHKKDASCSF